jgi:hypothetical protein
VTTLEKFGEAMEADGFMRALTSLWRALFSNAIRLSGYVGGDYALCLILILLAVVAIFCGGPTLTAAPIPF